MPPGGMGLERCLQSSLVTFEEYFFEELEFEEEDDEEMIGSESLHEIEVIIIIIIMDSTAATQRVEGKKESNGSGALNFVSAPHIIYGGFKRD